MYEFHGIAKLARGDFEIVLKASDVSSAIRKCKELMGFTDEKYTFSIHKIIEIEDSTEKEDAMPSINQWLNNAEDTHM